MKYIIAILVLIFSINISAQTEQLHANDFIRVYDQHGKLLGKGKIRAFTETSLELNNRKNVFSIAVSSIGSIRTKRSASNNIFLGMLIGGSGMAIVELGTSPDSYFSPGETAAIYTAFGVVAGAAIGGITALFKNSRTFIINGDIEKWKTFSGMLSEPLIAEDKATEVDTGLPFSN